MFIFCVFQKFLFFVLKSSDVLDVLVPILFYLNDARADQCESHRAVCVCVCFSYYYMYSVCVCVQLVWAWYTSVCLSCCC